MSNTLRTKATLKSWFVSHATPTESEFNDLITTTVVEGGNSGSLVGAVQVGSNVSATATGAWAIGSNVISSNTNSISFGDGIVNDVPTSLQVGANGPRLIGSGQPATPRNGDLWVGQDGHVYIFSNGAAFQI